MAAQLCHVTLPNGVTELLGVSASEATGINGKITFTPVLNDVVGTGGGLGVPDQVETFVKDGQWVDQAGNPGAWFVRPDSTDATFVYSAKVDLGYRTGGGNAVRAFHIAVPAAPSAVLDEIRALPGPPYTWITKGETGPPPDITNGTIATGAPGSAVALTFTETSPGVYVADGSVPRGQDGLDGAPGGSDAAQAAWIADTASQTRAELDATYNRAFRPEQFGDVAGDATAAVNAAIAAAQAVAGTVTLSPNVTYVCLGAITPAYTGTDPIQMPVRITSPGAASANGRWAANPLNGGATLDLRYDGTDGLHPAKIDTRGAGMIEIDHINLVSGGTDDFPFFQTTNTTVHAHHNFIRGNAAKSGAGCKQDVFILGGTSATLGSGADAPFQGYGSKIHDNWFDHVRRGVWGRAYCNSVPIENNTFSMTCGNDGTGTGNYGGAIEFTGNPTAGFTVGNSTRGNTIEIVYYKYAVALYWATRCTIGPDGYWDPGSTYQAGVYCDPTATFNNVVGGYSDDRYPLTYDPGQTNSSITTAQSRYPLRRQTELFTGNVPAVTTSRYGTGPYVMDVTGDSTLLRTRHQPAGADPYAQIATQRALTVADVVTTSGSAIVTSATAAWTREHVGMPIFGTGIPNPAIIMRYISATSVELSAACTATATGVTIQYGSLGTASTTEIQFHRRHIATVGLTPTGAVDVAAGTGATFAIAGTDTTGLITLTTGTSPTAGRLCHWNPNLAFAVNPARALLFPKNAAAAGLVSSGLWVDNTHTVFNVNSTVAPVASTVYLFDYLALT